MTYVLDACALLAFLNDESGAEGIETILNQSVTGECAVSMHINNLLEVFYGQLRKRGLEIATIVLAAVDAYSITIIDTISDPVFHKAAHIKATYKRDRAVRALAEANRRIAELEIKK